MKFSERIQSFAETNAAFFLLSVYLLFISILELLACTKQGIYSVIASRVWLGTGLLLLAVLLAALICRAVSDFRGAHTGEMLCFLLFSGMLLACLANLQVSDINPDSASQLAAGLEALQEADWNYTGNAFLGYPCRQYVLAALPTLLFGRSIFSMHLGFAFPFLAGMTLLFLELRAWMRETGLKEAYALLPVGAFVVIPFITEYYRNFEQAFTPVALTTLCAALYLRLLRRQDALSAFALSWTGCMLADSYTPALASLGLLCVFILLNVTGYWQRNNGAYAAILSRRKLPSITGILLTANLCTFFAATLLVERGDRITQLRDEQELKQILRAWTDFFSEKHARFFGLFAGAVILYLVLSLTLRLRLYNLMISGWTLAVIVLSNRLKGYTSYEESWILERNMIIVPVLITAIFFAMTGFLARYKADIRSSSVYIMFLLTLGIGIFNFHQVHHSFIYFAYVQPMKFLIRDIGEQLTALGEDTTGEYSLTVFTDNIAQTNIQDYARYFFPDAVCRSCSTAEIQAVLTEDDAVRPALYYSEVPFPDGQVYGDTRTCVWHDYNYGTDITWYRHTRI